jgi:hypothetical protein
MTLKFSFFADHVGFGSVSYQENVSTLFKRLKVKSMLDLGAGRNDLYKMCHAYGIRQLLLDLHYPSEQTDNYHRVNVSITSHLEVLQAIQDFSGDSKVDAVICIQALEHLTREDGILLLQNISSYAKKLVVVETPNGFVYQEGTFDNPFQAHLSGWNYEDFDRLGYSIIGTFGLKFLRQSSNKGAFKIYFKGLRIVELLVCKYFIFRFFPKLSYNIFAYKIL